LGQYENFFQTQIDYYNRLSVTDKMIAKAEDDEEDIRGDLDEMLEELKESNGEFQAMRFEKSGTNDFEKNLLKKEV